MIADDWQVGDLALCVNVVPHPLWGPPPVRRGAVYTVTAVEIERNEITGLRIEEVDSYPCEWFWARRFRKIRPHQQDEDDREVIALYTYAPLRTPEPVA